MRTEDTTIAETTALLEAGRDEQHAILELEHVAGKTDDPALRHELEAVIAGGSAASRAFRRAWDRTIVAFVVGR